MMKKIAVILLVAAALGTVLGACSGKGCEVPQPKESYRSVDAYVQDYSSFVNKMTAYMKSGLKDGKVKDLTTAKKWMKAYSLYQARGWVFKDEDKKELEKKMGKVFTDSEFMKFFMPFNRAVFSK